MQHTAPSTTPCCRTRNTLTLILTCRMRAMSVLSKCVIFTVELMETPPPLRLR